MDEVAGAPARRGGASAHGEVILSWDAERLGTLGNRHLRLTMGAETFHWGRVDVDGRLEVQVFHRDVTTAMAGLAGALRPSAFAAVGLRMDNVR